MRGLSLAGAEFGQLVPGELGRDYIYPSVADFEFAARQGFNVVRLPFRWERLQPDVDGELVAAEWSQILGSIKTARRLGLLLILDPHNYARRRVRADDFTAYHLIGSAEVPVAAFVKFWAQIAARTAGEPHVIYAIMNEPSDIASEIWLDIANQVIAAIRTAGANQLILVPGVAYTGAHSWVEAHNTILSGVSDKGQNFAIEVHQYLDADSSGKSAVAISESIGVERLQVFQAWAREHKLRAFLGEFGAGPDALSLKALAAMVREVEAHPDVWVGWTAWAAGPWWPDDEPMRLSPSRSGRIPPQTKLLSRIARGKT
jgi:endoglucanase